MKTKIYRIAALLLLLLACTAFAEQPNCVEMIQATCQSGCTRRRNEATNITRLMPNPEWARGARMGFTPCCVYARGIFVGYAAYKPGPGLELAKGICCQ